VHNNYEKGDTYLPYECINATPRCGLPSRPTHQEAEILFSPPTPNNTLAASISEALKHVFGEDDPSASPL
jgi:hypothetical protein